MATARINVFQRLVRQWDRLHPYNAAQVLKIVGQPDRDLIHRAWIDTLATLGLGQLRVDGSRYSYAELNGSAAGLEVRVVPAGTGLTEFISQELNLPFDESAGLSFRPFIVQEDQSFYLGVIYQHWVADSVSIRTLLREWFVRIYDPPAARRTPVQLPAGGYWRYFNPEHSRWHLGDGFLSSVRWSSRFKRVRRIETPGFADFNVRFSMYRAEDGWIERLQRATRPLGMTLNDVFLAAIAEACHVHVPVQFTPRRQDLALGSIVDLRPHTTHDLSNVFGLFLGFTSVVCRPRDLDDFPRLLRCVASQTARHKESGVPQASAFRIMAGLVAGRMLSREKVVTFYRKRVPLAGGISNVNMNRSWAQQYHPHPLQEYIRVSPTGPMMPAVFTTTTLGKSFHFGLTRRASLIDDSKADALASTFMNRLNQLIESTST